MSVAGAVAGMYFSLSGSVSVQQLQFRFVKLYLLLFWVQIYFKYIC